MLKDGTGSAMRDKVKYEAIFAVYEDITNKAKNHQTVPTILPDTDLKKHVYMNNCELYVIKYFVFEDL